MVSVEGRGDRVDRSGCLDDTALSYDKFLGTGILSRKLTITTYFQNSAGLKEGAAVNLQGVTIGTVKSVTLVTAPSRKLTPVKVTMKLNESATKDLREDSRASLTTVGVLGDTVVDLNSQYAVGPPLKRRR